jgi:acyl-CoA-binding protein
LFKQATVGPNNTKPPGRLDLINRAKWTAWKNVAKLSKTEAKKKVPYAASLRTARHLPLGFSIARA